jgi:hypothetical protein
MRKTLTGDAETLNFSYRSMKYRTEKHKLKGIQKMINDWDTEIAL